ARGVALTRMPYATKNQASLFDADRVFVDHGVGEEPSTHLLHVLLRGFRVLRGQVDQERLRAVDASKAFETEKREGLLDVVALGIRDAFLEADFHPDLDHSVALPQASALPS